MNIFMKNIIAFLILQNFQFLQSQNLKIDSMQNVIQRGIIDTSKVRTYIAIGEAYLSQHDHENAFKNANLAINIAIKINYKLGIISSHQLLGLIYRSSNNFTEAIKHFLEVAQLSTELKIMKGLGSSYGNIALIYSDMGNYPEATGYYLKALKIFEDEVNNTLKKTPNAKTNIKELQHFIASTYNNMSHINTLQKNYNLSLQYNQMAIKVWKQIGYNNMIVSPLHNIAVIYIMKGRLNDAFLLLQQALKINHENGNKEWESNNLSAIASVFVRASEENGIKQYKDSVENKMRIAITYLKQSLTINEQIKQFAGICDQKIRIAEIYIMQNKYSQALNLLESALNSALELHLKDYITKSYQSISEIEKRSGDFKQSLLHYKLFILYRDSLYNEENTKKMVQAQMNYDFEKKEAEAKTKQDNKDAIANEEKEKQIIVRNSFIGGFAFVLLLALMILRGYRNKRKANLIITKQKEAVEVAKQIIEKQKKEVEEKQKEILDSIRYAQRIQRALITSENYITKSLNNLNLRSNKFN